jgi:hypothetical protein
MRRPPRQQQLREARRRRDDPDPNINIDPEIFPGYTEYQKFCCCCYGVGYGSDRKFFCGNWRVDFIMPFFVTVLSLGNLIYLYFFCFLECGIAGYICVPIVTIFCFIFLYCLYKTIYLGPGYFPFYYDWAKKEILPETEDTTVNGVNESLAGLANNEVQYKWSKSLPQPPRCTMSRLAQRFVIRPDHYCGYVGTWIGKKNHKLFILFNLYGFIFCICSGVGHILIIATQQFEKNFVKILISLLFTLLAFSFGVMTFQFFNRHMQMAKRNYTSWEKWNDYQHFFEDCDLENVENNQRQVFGENMSCCVKYCPFAAFPTQTNEELVEGYVPYESLLINNTEPIVQQDTIPIQSYAET